MTVEPTRVFMSEQEFEALPDYSSAVPTGTTIGKRWRRAEPARWLMGEYVPDPSGDPRYVGIVWREIVIGELDYAI